jgi:2-octaprenylphenol hydroxylase
VRTEQDHARTAWQRFLPTGPLALLPLPDGRSSLVWSTSRAEAARLRALPRVEFDAELTSASGAVLGHCETVTPLAAFPLALQYALHYVLPRIVLLGDAAHVVHPLAGQGLNLGLLDCATLVEELKAARDVRAFGDMAVLRRYERRRRSENLLAATAFDGLERLFANSNPALAWLRSAGLDAVAGLPFVRRQFARRALGLSGDVPRMPV